MDSNRCRCILLGWLCYSPPMFPQSIYHSFPSLSNILGVIWTYTPSSSTRYTVNHVSGSTRYPPTNHKLCTVRARCRLGMDTSLIPLLVTQRTVCFPTGCESCLRLSRGSRGTEWGSLALANNSPRLDPLCKPLVYQEKSSSSWILLSESSTVWIEYPVDSVTLDQI